MDGQKGLLKEEVMALPSLLADVVSMDAEGLYDQLIDFVLEFIIGYEEGIEEITLVTIWNSLIFLDQEQNNKPLSRVRTWADTEGDLGELEAQDDESSLTGCPKHYKFTRWKLIRPGHQELIRKGYRVGSLADYIYYSFTGEWVMSHMMASGSGLLKLEEKDWYNNGLEALNLQRSQLPLLVDWKYKTLIDQTLAKRLGLSDQVKVQVANGDGGLNQYAEGGFELGVWSLSIGTSGAMRCLSKDPKVTQGLWCHTLGEGYYVKGAAISGAGNCVQWFLKAFKLEDQFLVDVESTLSQLENESLPYYLPFIYGEQSPGWVSQRVSGYSEPIENYELVELYYSLIEGISFNLYQGYKLLIEEEGVPESIVISGGVVRTTFWLQLIADVLGRTLSVSTMEHSSLIGGIRSCLEVNESPGTVGMEVVADKVRHRQLMKRFEGYNNFYHQTIEGEK